MSNTTNDLLLKIENISKHFGGLAALQEVHLDLRYNEVHAVVGENGAGKSTLMNILGGILKPDKGKIFYKGKQIEFESPNESIRSGIAIIHQELSVLPALNIMENIFMGHMDARFGWVLWSILRDKTRELLERVGLKSSPYRLVETLSISDRQLVEIAKALALNANLIIMDEPNSSLTRTETEQLFRVILELKEKGVSILYVSHKLDEVLEIADRVTVLRDGRYIDTIDKSEATSDKIIKMMVGRDLVRGDPVEKRASGGVILEVRLISGKCFKDISFNVRKGEIVGFFGLVGSGRSEIAHAIFGDAPVSGGKIIWQQRTVHFKSPRNAIKNGIALVPEDRKEQSLFMGLPISLNMSITQLPIISLKGIIDNARIREIIKRFTAMLNIKMASADYPVSSLSGGNQQKVVLSRWLATDPSLLILDEPTHGIDVGAKAEIYKLMRELTNRGLSIILISSELPEIILMSDRVVILHEGRVTGILKHDELSEDKIMEYATRSESDVVS